MSDKGVLQFSSAHARSSSGAAAASKAILVPSWQRARDLSCSALLAGEMCLVVTGLPGTGKTLLVETVARVLRSTGWTIVTFAAKLPSEAQLAELTGSAAILIDDADRLSATDLRTLNRSRQCSVLLAGATGFEKRCPADSRVTLAPLPPDEVAIYVDLWLEQAGLSTDAVTEAAIAHLADVSAGIPRVLGMLLTDSVKGARAGGSELIEDHHVEHAAWRHVERTAARRLNRATSTPSRAAEPDAARPVGDLEQLLAQAPFANTPASGERRSLALRLAGIGLAAGLVAVAGLLTSPQWLPWAVATYDQVVAKRNSLPALTTIPAASAPSVEQPRAAEVTDVLPASVMPLAAPTPAQTPPAPAPAVVPASPQPSLETADIRPAPIQPPDTTPVVAVPPGADAESLSPTVIKLLNQRGQQMIELNDFSAARLLFAKAAESGSVTAMLALGRSYDPNVVGTLASVAGVDPAQAAQWYRKAATLGSSDAAIMLQQLQRSPRE